MSAPKIPLPGKVVGVVEGEVLKKIALISVEEHVYNCAAFLRFVSPSENKILEDALLFHDIGKKLFRDRRIYLDHGEGSLKRWGRKDAEKILKRDYTATMCPELQEQVSEEVDFSRVMVAFLRFLGLKKEGSKNSAEGIKAYPVREDPQDSKSPVVFASYRLDRPFGNHAAPIKVEHLPEGLRDRERLASLIRLHHGFSVSKVVPEAAEWEPFPNVLYSLMTLDHLGSSWAERLVLLEEGGSKREFEGGVDFGEIESWMNDAPKAETNTDGTKTVSAGIQLRRRPGHEEVVTFSVTYFAREVNYVDPGFRK
jgi:hypothetical protein